MDSGLFQQKMKDLKQKLSSINDDIVEIQKNNKKKDSFTQKEISSINPCLNIYQISKKVNSNQMNSIKNEQNLDSLYNNNNDFLNDLTTPTPSEGPKITPNKKIFINENFYEALENNRIKKNLEKDLVEENNYTNNNYNNFSNSKIKSKHTYSNIINLDDELSFKQKDEKVRVMNKLSSVLSPTRNPIKLRTNKRNNLFSINSLNKEINKKQNKIKELINHKCNQNLTINNNNTICITSENNETIQRDNKIRRIIPLAQNNNNLRYDVLGVCSLVSPKNKCLLNSKTVYFENKLKKNRTNNLSNDYELIRNETQTQIQNNNYNKLSDRTLDMKNNKFFTGKMFKVKKIIIDNYKENNKNTDFNENIEMKNTKKINFNGILNKRKINSLSYNKLMLNGNTLINDKSNKLIKIQNKIFNISDNIKTNINFDKKKLIVKINKQLLKKRKKNSSIKNSKNLNENTFILNSKGEKSESEISSDIVSKLNQNIVESKITNNFILKLIKLYYESTGLTINKDNDLNSTLNILYNWIENISKKYYIENKKINQDLQYKILRQKIMNQYQLKNKNELKSFLFKILGND